MMREPRPLTCFTGGPPRYLPISGRPFVVATRAGPAHGDGRMVQRNLPTTSFAPLPGRKKLPPTSLAPIFCCRRMLPRRSDPFLAPANGCQRRWLAFLAPPSRSQRRSPQFFAPQRRSPALSRDFLPPTTAPHDVGTVFLRQKNAPKRVQGIYLQCFAKLLTVWRWGRRAAASASPSAASGDGKKWTNCVVVPAASRPGADGAARHPHPVAIRKDFAYFMFLTINHQLTTDYGQQQHPHRLRSP